MSAGSEYVKQVAFRMTWENERGQKKDQTIVCANIVEAFEDGMTIAAEERFRLTSVVEQQQVFVRPVRDPLPEKLRAVRVASSGCDGVRQ